MKHCFCLALALTLLSPVPGNSAAAEQVAPSGSLPSSQAKDATTDLVVARVSGRPITEGQVISAINQIINQRQMSLDQLPGLFASLFKEALDNLVTIALLKNQAQQQNVVVDAARIDQQLQQISKQFSSQEEFRKAMNSQGVTEADLRRNIEESLGMQVVIDLAVKDIPGATPAEVRKFYEENPGRFATPEQVHAALILLKTDSKNTPEQNAEIRKRLEKIRADIESMATAFADAATKYSEDSSSARKGGDLGFFPRGSMEKPIEDAAFAAKPGTLSPIIKTPSGFQILQVFEQKPAGKLPLDEVAPGIKQLLDQANKRKATQKLVEGLRAKSTIETYMTQEEFARRHPPSGLPQE